jgi:Fic-DOC domain mobile mystery protein B
MFGDVWRWAGLHRTRDTNLGVDALSIVESVGQLMGDALYWIENAVFERDELALRFHHRLVAIHPFPNGNGRVSRMIGDLLVVALGNERFTWGAFLAAEDPAAVRRTYIEALRAADAGDVGLLLAFART